MVFNEETLLKILKDEKPALVGVQQNGCGSVFYRRKEGYLRIVFIISSRKLEIITFYITESIPKLI